jgi:hypothetical protein
MVKIKGFTVGKTASGHTWSSNKKVSHPKTKRKK